MSDIENLAQYGITLIKETKSNASILLKDHAIESKMSRALFEKLRQSAITSIKNTSKLPPISFGVEFEFVGDKTRTNEFNHKMNDLTNGSYESFDRYIHNKGCDWILGRDSSIDTSLSKVDNPQSYELSTPKLKLNSRKNIETLRSAVDLIKNTLHGEVNRSCGTHVHIGISVNDYSLSKTDLRNLLSVYSSIESKVFDPIVPLSRRGNRFCKKTEPWLDCKYQKLSTRYCRFEHDDNDSTCTKLHLECRQLEGTLDVDLIVSWLIFQSHIITDILSAIKSNDLQYLDYISHCNAFDLLFKYDISLDIINLFIDRIIQFKSRTIQTI